MCLIAFNWADHPVYQLILVANRDEFFKRPTSSLHLWSSGFYGGKDLEGGGTWMGFHPKGRFAALTNYRDFTSPKSESVSRGHLVKDFLENSDAPLDYLDRIQTKMDQYEGFNLLVAEGGQMGYLSNFRKKAECVPAGLHGISNAFLNTSWPKVEQAKKELKNSINNNCLSESSLMGQLQSRSYAPEELLPHTSVSADMESNLSAQFIKVGKEYGTVNTTMILWKHSGEVVMKERRTITQDETKVEFNLLQE